MDGLNNFTWVKIGQVIFYRLGGGVEDFFWGGGITWFSRGNDADQKSPIDRWGLKGIE